jgi:putative zinc finger protein
MMDHAEAVRQKATEKYLLNELDPDLRDQFEEHMFDCQDCALDVRAAAMFVEQAKVALVESPATSELRVRALAPRPGWFSWFRPAFAMPVLALLLAVVGYQNLVTYPRLMRESNQPEVGSWASINVSTRGPEAKIVKVQPGEGFTLLVNRPPDSSYSAYTLQLYNPAGKLQWTGRIPASSPDDPRSVYVPGTGLEQGTYKLDIAGVTAAGQSLQTGSNPIEVQIQR